MNAMGFKKYQKVERVEPIKVEDLCDDKNDKDSTVKPKLAKIKSKD